MITIRIRFIREISGRKMLLPLLLMAMTTSAQEFSTRTPGQQWMDSVCQTVQLTPIVFTHEVPLILEDQASSIMTGQRFPNREVDLSHFRCGPFWVPDPPPLFDDSYCSFYSDCSLGQVFVESFVEGVVEGVLDAVFSKPKKSGKKEKKRIVDY